MGYNPSVYINPVRLRGYRGDLRTQQAHIVIDRSQIGPASNDIGFEKKDGKYILRISEYDENSKTFDFEDMKMIYDVQKVMKTIEQNSRYHLKSKKKLKDGRYEINVSVS